MSIIFRLERSCCGIFGAGVGGGLLATMGAVKGLGEGVAEGGEMGVKQQMMDKQAQQQLDRERTIQDLQQKFQTGENEKSRAFQTQQTQAEIAGRSNVARFEVEHKEAEAERGRTFSAGQNQAKLASEEKRTGISASARVLAAGEHAGSAGGANNKPEFTVHTVQEQGSMGRDASGNMTTIPGASHLIAVHRSGKQYMHVGGTVDPQSGLPTGGRMVPFDAATNQPIDTSKFPRPNAAQTADLIHNPDPGYAAHFEQKYGFLPDEYLSAVDAKNRQNQQPRQQLPIMNLFSPNAKITKSVTIGSGGGNSTEEYQDNSDNQPESPSEADTSAPQTE